MFFRMPYLPKWVLFAYAYITALLTGWSPPSESYYDTGTLLDAYDFVVVGSGSAGSVVANRLSANPAIKVLLMEAGGAPSAATEIPSFFGFHNNCPYEWNFRTVPQENACLGLEEERSKWTRGKVLGGSSTINSMMWVRGNRRDYDQWAENGATGWSYDEVLPYFKSIETFHIPEYANNGYHGDKGEIDIGYTSEHSRSNDAFLRGCGELGYEYVDYNGPTQTDLPVGKNLQDHVFVGGLAGTMEQDAVLPTARSLSSFISYFLHRDGPLSIPWAIEGVAFVNSPFMNASLDFPDIEIMYIGSSPSSEESETYLRDLGYKKEVYDKYYLPNRGKKGFTIQAILNRLKSTGEIKLKSTDPHDHPLLDPKYFSHPEDVLVAIEAAKIVLKVIDSKAMKALGIKRWDIPFPGCEDKTLWSDEYLECLIRHLTHTTWHYCCTCAMGTDNSSVVDPRLRVRGGITNLRVIDTSIMPYIVTANLNAPAHMIGARGAALVLEDYDLTGQVGDS